MPALTLGLLQLPPTTGRWLWQQPDRKGGQPRPRLRLGCCNYYRRSVTMSYSHRNAIKGSTRVARRAGT